MADIIGAEQQDSRRGVWARLAGIGSSLLLMILAASTTGCSSPERDEHEAVNSRDTGQYLSVGRSLAPDGTLLVHVVAERPAWAGATACGQDSAQSRLRRASPRNT
jgi:hypothetical protein